MTMMAQQNPQQNPREDGEYITGLARGLSVLRAFSADLPDLSLSQIATVTNLNPAVVRRCLNTLVHLGYVAQNGRRFQLLPEVTIFASTYLKTSKIEKIAEPHLELLRDRTGHSASMGVLSGKDIVYLANIPALCGSNTQIPVGTRLPADENAMGRILLARSGKASKPRVCDIGRPGAVNHCQQTARHEATQKGDFVVVRSDNQTGGTSVAVPVLQPDGTIFAAIACTTVRRRSDLDAFVRSRLPHLNEARRRIEAQLRLSGTL